MSLDDGIINERISTKYINIRVSVSRFTSDQAGKAWVGLGEPLMVSLSQLLFLLLLYTLLSCIDKYDLSWQNGRAITFKLVLDSNNWAIKVC